MAQQAVVSIAANLSTLTGAFFEFQLMLRVQRKQRQYEEHKRKERLQRQEQKAATQQEEEELYWTMPEYLVELERQCNEWQLAADDPARAEIDSA